MSSPLFSSTTLDPAELALPAFRPVARALRGFALRLGAGGTPFAVNGILRSRVWVRPHKLWEYTRGIAAVQAVDATRVLDFGGGATLPVFYLAHAGCQVLSLDVDAHLTEYTNRVGARRRWKLEATTLDLTRSAAPADWGQFDAVVSFSVLEHLPQALQTVAVERLAGLLRPGGVLAITFDYGSDAPVQGAVRDLAHVQRLVEASRLAYFPEGGFRDSGRRFTVDKRHPDRLFTFASLFLQKR